MSTLRRQRRKGTKQIRGKPHEGLLLESGMTLLSAIMAKPLLQGSASFPEPSCYDDKNLALKTQAKTKLSLPKARGHGHFCAARGMVTPSRGSGLHAGARALRSGS
uniref:Uncharacterized protein n=2 Tax=Anthoceros TaxID=3233 RepID=A0A6M8AYD4_ANTPU|nr:hypothetical protein [Anthoceros punctatus]YP_009863171.1 hypothetical protein [Anthoceros agrestis]QKD76585.1 hypothetical protein [Anthoceros punctatus]QKD76627.1 hypothetical protein [Anthoceros agrestis]